MGTTGYKRLVGMVLRLIGAGMRAGLAIELVSYAYCCDPTSLKEWIENHTNLQVGE